MPTLYVDHNVIVKALETGELAATLADQKARLVVSNFTVYELAKASDRAQATRRATALDRFKPLWTRYLPDIKRDELARFVVEQTCGIQRSPVVGLCRNAFTALPARSRTLNQRLTVESLVNSLQDDPAYLATVSTAADGAKNALTIRQTAGKPLLKATEEVTFKAYIDSMLPPTSPKGKPYNVIDQQMLVNHCWAHRTKLYSQCPALAAENMMSAARANDPLRKATEQDAADLQHACVALAYCDAFVTNDGFLHDCAKKSTVRAQVFRNLADFRARK